MTVTMAKGASTSIGTVTVSAQHSPDIRIGSSSQTGLGFLLLTLLEGQNADTLQISPLGTLQK